MGSLPIPVLFLIFAGAAVMVWWAGVRLSRTTDSLDENLGLADALGGMVLLAVATNLPDLAIVVTASVSGNVSLAAGSILGGVAIQVIVVAVLDLRGGGEGVPLTSRTRTLEPVLEAVMVIVSLSLVVMGAQLDAMPFYGFEPMALLILLAWLAGLLVVRHANRGMAWKLDEEKHRVSEGESNPETTASTKSLLGKFLFAAVLTLGGGVLLERSSSAMATQLGIESVVFGATALAAATTIPDLSIGNQSVKLGNHQLVISQVFGAGAFLPTLFLLMGVVAGSPVLPNPGGTGSNLYLASFGVVLMCVYLVGLLVRSRRTVLRMGIDSWLILAVYLIGIVGLVLT